MRLKSTLAFVLNLISVTSVFSQEKEFFNKEGETCTEGQAAYYRVATKNEEGKLSGIVNEYYLNGKIRRTTHYEAGIREGRETSYYSNGRQETERHFENGRQMGQAQSWYANGQLKETGTEEVREKPDISSLSRIYVYRIESYL